MTRPVLHIADYGGPYGGSFVASMRALQREVTRRGSTFVLAVSGIASGRRWLEELRGDGVEVVVLSPTPNRAGDVVQLCSLLRRLRPAIVHTHFTRYDVAAWMATHLALPQHRPALLWHVHSAFPQKDTLARRVKDGMKMHVMGASTHALTVSPALRESFIGRGFPPARVHFVPNGVDFDRLRSRQPRDEIRASLGIPPKARTILAFGWEPRTKGVDVIFGAREKLARLGFDVHWLIVGGGSLESFAARHPCENATITAARDDVGSLYAACDMFVSASRWEGMSYSLAEAIASELRVVASDIRGTSWTGDIPGVRFFKSEDAAGLADAVIRSFSDTRPEALRSAADLVKCRFALGAWAEKVTEIYDHARPGWQRQ